MDHRPVCSLCDLEMIPSSNDIILIDFSDKGAYKLWCADEAECPDCGTYVVIGFGNTPFWRPESRPFPQAEINEHDAVGTLRYNFESVEQRERFMALPKEERNHREWIGEPEVPDDQ